MIKALFESDAFILSEDENVSLERRIFASNFPFKLCGGKDRYIYPVPWTSVSPLVSLVFGFLVQKKQQICYVGVRLRKQNVNGTSVCQTCSMWLFSSSNSWRCLSLVVLFRAASVTRGEAAYSPEASCGERGMAQAVSRCHWRRLHWYESRLLTCICCACASTCTSVFSLTRLGFHCLCISFSVVHSPRVFPQIPFPDSLAQLTGIIDGNGIEYPAGVVWQDEKMKKQQEEKEKKKKEEEEKKKKEEEEKKKKEEQEEKNEEKEEEKNEEKKLLEEEEATETDEEKKRPQKKRRKARTKKQTEADKEREERDQDNEQGAEEPPPKRPRTRSTTRMLPPSSSTSTSSSSSTFSSSSSAPPSSSSSSSSSSTPRAPPFSFAPTAFAPSSSSSSSSFSSAPPSSSSSSSSSSSTPRAPPFSFSSSSSSSSSSLAPSNTPSKSNTVKVEELEVWTVLGKTLHIPVNVNLKHLIKSKQQCGRHLAPVLRTLQASPKNLNGRDLDIEDIEVFKRFAERVHAEYTKTLARLVATLRDTRAKKQRDIIAYARASIQTAMGVAVAAVKAANKEIWRRDPSLEPEVVDLSDDEEEDDRAERGSGGERDNKKEGKEKEKEETVDLSDDEEEDDSAERGSGGERENKKEGKEKEKEETESEDKGEQFEELSALDRHVKIPVSLQYLITSRGQCDGLIIPLSHSLRMLASSDFQHRRYCDIEAVQTVGRRTLESCIRLLKRAVQAQKEKGYQGKKCDIMFVRGRLQEVISSAEFLLKAVDKVFRVRNERQSGALEKSEGGGGKREETDAVQGEGEQENESVDGVEIEDITESVQTEQVESKSKSEENKENESEKKEESAETENESEKKAESAQEESKSEESKQQKDKENEEPEKTAKDVDTSSVMGDKTPLFL